MLRAFIQTSWVVTVLASLAFVGGCAPESDTDPGTEDTDSSDSALATHKVDSISTISYAPNSYVIGNAYPGWTDQVQGNPQFSKGAGNEGGAYYRWGYIYGENFDACAWINNATASATGITESYNKCGAGQQIDSPLFKAKFTNGMLNEKAGDGSLTHMHYAGSGCSNKNGYGNVDPWKVPATPANSTGAVPDGRTLLWRYVSKDGNWVMVRDPSNSGSKTEPNWYFVHRGCVSLANVD
jgi:hypothetical protein